MTNKSVNRDSNSPADKHAKITRWKARFKTSIHQRPEKIITSKRTKGNGIVLVEDFN